MVLCVVDGLGMRQERRGNAFQQAETPTLDALLSDHASTSLTASGAAVGLPADCVGNGEVGHLTLGAGRIVETTRTRIDRTLDNRKLAFVPMIDQTVRLCLYDECQAHLIGVVGGSTAYADMNHLYQLIETFDFNDVPVVVHAILDGEDCAPRSALTYLDRLQGFIEDRKATIGSVMGRHYAMDRNERWDRTYKAFHAMVRDRRLGPAAHDAETPYDVISQAYSRDVDDALVEPTRIGDYRGFSGDYLCDFSSNTDKAVWEWIGSDAGVAFNHRADGMRQLVAMLARQDIPDYVADDLLMDRHFPVRAFREHCFMTLASHGDAIDVPVAFPKEVIGATLGEIVASAGLKQLRCAESEKVMHVTSFFSGGRESAFDGETRKVVRSPRLVQSYEEKPEMAAAKVADAVLEGLAEGDADFILVNFANADMVAGPDAAKKALEAIDGAMSRICAAVREKHGLLIVTSDHGNCEQLLDPSGERHAAHTQNPVPFALLDAESGAHPLRDGGSLCDVAPTVLDLMSIDKPDAMTGVSLRTKSD